MIMKLIQFFLFLLFTAGAVNASPPVEFKRLGPDPKTMANDPRFKQFVYDFAERFKLWADLYKFPEMKNKEEFFQQLESCDQEIESANEVYASFHIDFEEAMTRQNDVHNALLTVLNDFPELQEVDEETAWKTIVEAGDIVVKDPENEMYEQKVMPPGEGGTLVNEITLEELWECLKKAVGLGVGTLISIGALQKLAQEGIQKAIVAATKIIAKRAGWIGAAIALAEFAICLRSAYYEDDQTNS
jgi:hypothetical protein